jgi:hypothetical protein
VHRRRALVRGEGDRLRQRARSFDRPIGRNQGCSFRSPSATSRPKPPT